MSEIERIVARVEAATGPTRVLDAEIAAICNRPDPDDPDRNLEIFERIIARVLAGGDDCEIPAYTASLDAALTLVPASDDQTATFWQIGNDGAGGDPSDYLARVLVCNNMTSREYRSVCATPALALVAACLRAHLERQAHD